MGFGVCPSHFGTSETYNNHGSHWIKRGYSDGRNPDILDLMKPISSSTTLSLRSHYEFSLATTQPILSADGKAKKVCHSTPVLHQIQCLWRFRCREVVLSGLHVPKVGPRGSLLIHALLSIDSITVMFERFIRPQFSEAYCYGCLNWFGQWFTFKVWDHESFYAQGVTT